MVWIGLALVLLAIGLLFWRCLEQLARIRRAVLETFEIVDQLLEMKKDLVDPELARLDTVTRKNGDQLTSLDRRLELNDNAIGNLQEGLRALKDECNLADVLTADDQEEDEDGD